MIAKEEKKEGGRDWEVLAKNILYMEHLGVSRYEVVCCFCLLLGRSCWRQVSQKPRRERYCTLARRNSIAALAPCGVSGKILKSVTNGCSAMELCCGRSRTRLHHLPRHLSPTVLRVVCSKVSPGRDASGHAQRAGQTHRHHCPNHPLMMQVPEVRGCFLRGTVGVVFRRYRGDGYPG